MTGDWLLTPREWPKNDINFAGQNSSLRLYADDTTTYASDRDTTTLEIPLNQDLNILVTWYSQNYLKQYQNTRYDPW